jgi:hypothetical protein
MVSAGEQGGPASLEQDEISRKRDETGSSCPAVHLDEGGDYQADRGPLDPVPGSSSMAPALVDVPTQP